MYSIKNEIERLTNIIVETKLTPMSSLPSDVRLKLDEVQLKLVKCLVRLLVSCQETTTLLSEKEKIIKDYLSS